ncbi:Putative pentatricopeptide repeat-containing protein At1g09680 [Linum perenne]
MMPPPSTTMLLPSPSTANLLFFSNSNGKFPKSGAVNSLPTPTKSSSSSSTKRHNPTTLSTQKQAKQPDNFKMTTLLNHLDKDENFDSAERILNQLLENGSTCSPPDVTVFTTLVDCFCKRGQLQKAFQVIDVMAKVGLKPSIQTYNCLIKGLCYVGKVEHAFQLLEDIKKMGNTVPDIYTYTVMMHGFCKVGRSDEAMELLDEALEKGLKPNVVSFNALFHGYNVQGRPLDGMKLLHKIKSKGFTPDHICYSTLLRGLLLCKKIPAAAMVYDEMVAYGYEADEGLMNNLLRGLCKRRHLGDENGLLGSALQVFEEMTKSGFAVDRRACNLLIESACQFGKVEDALVNLNRMVKLGYMPTVDTMNVVMRALCLKGEANKATGVMVLMFENHIMPPRLSYELLIDELIQQHEYLGAYCVYGAALIRGVAPRYERECEIVQVLIQ